MFNFTAAVGLAAQFGTCDGSHSGPSSVRADKVTPNHVQPNIGYDAIVLDVRCMQGERKRDAIRALLNGSAARVVILMAEIPVLYGLAVNATEHLQDVVATLKLTEHWRTPGRVSTSASRINATGVAVLDEANRLAALGCRVTVVSADQQLRLQVRNCPARPRVMYVDVQSLLDTVDSASTSQARLSR